MAPLKIAVPPPETVRAEVVGPCPRLPWNRMGAFPRIEMVLLAELRVAAPVRVRP